MCLHVEFTQVSKLLGQLLTLHKPPCVTDFVLIHPDNSGSRYKERPRGKISTKRLCTNFFSFSALDPSMSFDRIPKGSLLLVTGATGLIGSAVTDAALARGFKVRGVTRSISKAVLFQKSLDDKYGKGNFELVEVKDLAAPDAFDGVLEGVAGVLHLATDSSFSISYDVVVGSVVAATVGLMKAAAKVPSVKSFVLTSSRIAIFNPDYDQPEISPKLGQWGDHFVDAAKQTPDDHPMKPVLIYAASKVQGEHAAWDYYNSAHPSYSFNAILPDLVLGPAFNPHPRPILQFVKPASLAVDVRDVASVHLAALLSTSTQGKRIWAAAHRFEINDILAIWREAFPQRKFVEDFKLPQQPKITLELAESEKLLKAFEGRSWLSLKESVIANVQDVL
ncbi:NAD(P)-binding protein [Mycena sanguinolenta]|uniref:NAD(P)-binding protein n=1 Tax=Mycena sanguinolenta TaxID=230812 RepID=A0A8H6ZK24_9AGAR|nr:NAD(P)-binding protein [Mycena sanguinolenta]